MIQNYCDSYLIHLIENRPSWSMLNYDWFLSFPCRTFHRIISINSNTINSIYWMNSRNIFISKWSMDKNRHFNIFSADKIERMRSLHLKFLSSYDILLYLYRLKYQTKWFIITKSKWTIYLRTWIRMCTTRSTNNRQMCFIELSLDDIGTRWIMTDVRCTDSILNNFSDKSIIRWLTETVTWTPWSLSVKTIENQW